MATKRPQPEQTAVEKSMYKTLAWWDTTVVHLKSLIHSGVSRSFADVTPQPVWTGLMVLVSRSIWGPSWWITDAVHNTASPQWCHVWEAPPGVLTKLPLCPVFQTDGQKTRSSADMKDDPHSIVVQERSTVGQVSDPGHSPVSTQCVI